MSFCPVLKKKGKTAFCRKTGKCYPCASRSYSDLGAVQYRRWHVLAPAMGPGVLLPPAVRRPDRSGPGSRRVQVGAGASRLPHETPQPADEGQKKMVPTGASVSSSSGEHGTVESALSPTCREVTQVRFNKPTHPSFLSEPQPPGSLRVPAITWVPSGNTPPPGTLRVIWPGGWVLTILLPMSETCQGHSNGGSSLSG